MADALARGDVDITFSGWETIKKFAADMGTTIDYTYPEDVADEIVRMLHDGSLITVGELEPV